MINVGDVIQINEYHKDVKWIGCLMIVNDVRSWGVQAGMHVPGMGNTYLRVNHNEYDRIGRAALIEEVVE